MAQTITLVLIIALCSVGNLFAQEERPEFNPCQAVENLTLFKPLGEIRTNLTNDGLRLPPDCSESFFGQVSAGGSIRFAASKVYTWQPTNFFHMPAYFDDVPLERYGQTRHPHIQPLFSGTKFFLQLLAIPYKMGVNRPHDCVTTLGHQPPGNCVPCLKQSLPHEAAATFIEAAAAVGVVFLLP